jgi:hypothetical protein
MFESKRLFNLLISLKNNDYKWNCLHFGGTSQIVVAHKGEL